MINKKELWNIVLSELEVSLSPANFKTWFANTSISEIKDNDSIVVISVPTNFSKNWLEEKYHKFILDAMQKEADNKIKKVIYSVNPPLADNKQGLRAVSMDKILKTAEPKIDQNKLNKKYNFDSFVVGSGSELAYAACLAVAKDNGKKYNPLFIYGGVGLGKTHLAQAIANKRLEENPNASVVYTNAEKFTNEFIHAITNKTIDGFKEKYRKINLFLIDDVEFMAGKERTQEEFFHTFNSLYEDDQQIVITSDRLPKAIPAFKDRLTSRLEWGLIVDISPPDFETRVAILRKKCKEKEINLNDNILRYLASNIQDNVRELEGALNKLIVYFEFHHMELDLERVKNILSALKVEPKKVFVKPREIIKIVADFYGIDAEEMIGPSRKKEIAFPRQVVMYLMRKESGASFPLIGKEVGRRDHTTAMYAFEKIKKEVKKEGSTRKEIELIKQRIYNK